MVQALCYTVVCTIQTGNLIEVLIFPLYGIAGYLTHLKVIKFGKALFQSKNSWIVKG